LQQKQKHVNGKLIYDKMEPWSQIVIQI
jgi:predicted NUDIX family phosphoesterase